MAGISGIKISVLGLSLIALAGCDENGQFAFPTMAPQSAGTASTAVGAVAMVEQDVESPEVFNASEAGLWDGRPSLGGVWVAHPDVTDPERVIIRNTANGTFVIGALFRRERDNPGPRLQVSSDAAEALGMLAGAPADLSVIALRRQEVAQPAAPAESRTETFDAPDAVEATSLDPIASAEAALDAIEGSSPRPVASTAPAAAVTPAVPIQSSSLTKAFIQVGIFSVKANADRTAERLRGSGIVPTVIPGESQGRQFYRVVVGPAGNKSERAAILKSVKSQGFTDAYFVTN
ncbi:MAG: SPOR domain-containing protein [Paracoccaceae bacterium]|nr:SPOR domain-containing protein [Paracoccaceae bacterium]